MPTALDRVQVLLQPEEYAELSMLAKEERRSLASMAAVLVVEAIRKRVQEGVFTPNSDDPVYAAAKERQVARALGKKPDSPKSVIDQIDLKGRSVESSKNNKDKAAEEKAKKAAIEALSLDKASV